MAAAENRGVHPLYAATSAVAPFVVRTDHLTREKDNFRWALPSRGDTSPCPSVPKTQPCKWESDQSYLRMRWQGDKSECYSNNYYSFNLPYALISAPLSTRKLTVSSLLVPETAISGVTPSRFRTLIFAPFATRYAITSVCPKSAA